VDELATYPASGGRETVSSVRLGVAAIILCGIVMLLARVQVADLMERAEFLTAEQELISSELLQLRNLQDALLDLEATERGFLLSANERYLASRDASQRDFTAALARLRVLFHDNRDALARVDELGQLGKAKQSTLDDAIRQRRDSGLDAALAVTESDADKQATARFRERMTALVTWLNRLRTAAAEEQLALSHSLILIGRYTIALILLLVGVAIGFLTLSIRRLEETQRQREREAMHDALTGLPNRRYLGEWLDIALAAAARNQQQLALLYFDLDGFKAVNDRFGHAAGDRVLQVIAVRLRGAVRASDFVARLGCDEFVAVLPDVRPMPALAALLERLHETIAEAAIPELGDGDVTASIGIAMYPDNGKDAAELLTFADREMYRIKERRRGTGRVPSPIPVGTGG
jgi:diguanylate cyclase (GGDEF)-like protein